MRSVGTSTAYLATEFAGDPPRPVARWYKVQAGTYARFTDNRIDFFNPADLKTEQPMSTVIEYVASDGSEGEIDAIEAAFRQHRAKLGR